MADLVHDATELTNLLAKLFIARTDTKAIQHPSGAYTPKNVPWSRKDLEDHLSGRKTYGHYLINSEQKCKIFAFDIDFIKTEGVYPVPSNHTAWDNDNKFLGKIATFYPRQAWKDRSHPSRPWAKQQLKVLASRLCRGIRQELDLPCAVTYSGSKGVHVYGLFDGDLELAQEVRAGAHIVRDAVLPNWKYEQTHWRCENKDPIESFPNFEIEIFPKQDTINEGGYGNLLRLPLGKNLHNPKDPTFFLDMSDALTDFKPVDPVLALRSGNPFLSQSEMIARVQ